MTMSEDTTTNDEPSTVAKIADALASDTAIKVYIAVFVIGVNLLAFVAGWRYLGVPMLLLILYMLSFYVGLAFMPLFAWTIGPSLGSFIPERLANLIFIVSMVGVRRGVLEQQETDEYVIDRAEAGIQPLSYWKRWALAPFGITFEVTKQAFGSAAVDAETREELENLHFDGDGTAVVPDLDRGEVDWYITKGDLKNEILVPIGQKLAELRNASGTDLSREAYAAALGKFGGDTSGSSNRLRLIGTIVFVVLGMGLGLVVHF